MTLDLTIRFSSIAALGQCGGSPLVRLSFQRLGLHIQLPQGLVEVVKQDRQSRPDPFKRIHALGSPPSTTSPDTTLVNG